MEEHSLIKANGFSMIELLIVLGVLSVVLTIAIPSIQSTKQNLLLMNYLTRLEHDLYYYQLYAVTTRQRVTVQFEAEEPVYTVIVGDKVVEERSGPAELQFIEGSLKLDGLVFLEKGGIQRAGRITIKYGKTSYSLVFQFARGRFYFERM
ncbi:prepilin-type N-terminal cleavage/methylation domain-containing protein [Salipaludibacillus agaradhaerens]|uniref:competence type IV pilus minor pilin ComGD n=1 Tax=Salipaludibacillus agaradhaerens TaxID=76935 RepID=UPI002151C7F1|nr:competence type IV pilus minor pilin ComGD [Salipaludibacillus agaradhaerens]MCR6106394.1 prepilin-type N-terminal cleavage/methylation domain-containing protein [Salipaludibacillus agaradhaerens]MCR6118427.1 prepilin-type N-terminal cleavage/methylation domain-containing protein [Salipaludibacillus agaradhaerens]UJW57532.1 prepilin-type N-terminal cleavage/methylation domain-containing protein [Bacillus sp. A116_S68]